MHRTSLLACSRCLPGLRRIEKQVSVRAFHNNVAKQRQSGSQSHSKYPRIPQVPAEYVPKFRPSRQQPSIDSRTTVYQRLKDYVRQWGNERTTRRLEAFGVTKNECKELLSTFYKCAHNQSLPSIDRYDAATLTQLSTTLTDLKQGLEIERSITRIFLDWVLLPEFLRLYNTYVSQSTLDRLRDIRSTTDFPHPAEWYPIARTMKRKIIMHVGPTNSGKTHHALRALAAARTGVYAGPLRLLAHEIWDRLNNGQIVPLGADVDTNVEPDDNGGTDILDGSPGAARVITKEANLRYAKACNLLTGEEQRLVADDALLSCTVEMLPLSQLFDVAVVDEIQMIADEARGSGWTGAVLGLCAKEIHLCGEETAIPIIEKLVKQTGDELLVNRYERLTPLHVADKSLDGDYNQIRKGDCVVTFSRSGIYAIKTEIERVTGFKCAVAYGRLPPEIRSEQAALFNDPSSGYDVMVGSDAIGMGLNLKIKRIVFSAVRKWDGKHDQELSVSQIKQIAGRAGRYGLHGDSNAAGIATTLHPEDLPILREALNTPLPPLLYAGLPHDSDALTRLHRVLPPGHRNLSILVDYFNHLCRFPEPYKFSSDHNYARSAAALDPYFGDLFVEDVVFWHLAPIQWRDEGSAEVARHFLRSFRDRMTVDLIGALETTGLTPALREVLKVMATQSSSGAESRLSLRNPAPKMVTLETLHRSLVLYLWMSMRNPSIFFDHLAAYELKEETEKAMDFLLQVLTKKGGANRPFDNRKGKSERRVLYKDRREVVLERAKRRAGRIEAVVSSI